MMTYNGGARGGTQIPLLTPIVTAGETHEQINKKKGPLDEINTCNLLKS